MSDARYIAWPSTANKKNYLTYYRVYGEGNQYELSVMAWDEGLNGYCYLLDEEVTNIDSVEQVITEVANVIDNDPYIDRSRQWDICGNSDIVTDYVTRYLGPLID